MLDQSLQELQGEQRSLGNGLTKMMNLYYLLETGLSCDVVVVAKWKLNHWCTMSWDKETVEGEKGEKGS